MEGIEHNISLHFKHPEPFFLLFKIEFVITENKMATKTMIMIQATNIEI